MSEDPMEKIIREALDREGFDFVQDGGSGGAIAKGLDFYLPDYELAIEVKQMHSPRISSQMERHKNVIAAQGKEAVAFLAAILCDYKRVNE